MTNKKSEREIFQVNYDNIKRVFFSTEDCFVLIDGLALVLDACLNQHTKWVQNGSAMYLHAIYYVERTLRMLLRLKSNIKLVFFTHLGSLIERCERQTQRDNLNLVYELVVFHLKSCEVFKDRLVFFSTLSEYRNSVKNDRIICYMGFSYIDTKLIPNQELAQQLRSHYIRLIQVNLDLGIIVILTKNFWYDSDSAKAYIVTKKKSRNTEVENFSLDQTAKDDEDEDYLKVADLNRQSLYSTAIDQMTDQRIQYLFRLHLKMLENVPLKKRCSIGDLDIVSMEQQYPGVYYTIQGFKFNMARLIRGVNRAHDFIELSPTCGAQIVDLFDSRLFWMTYKRLQESDEQISGAIFAASTIISTTDKKDMRESKIQIDTPIKTDHIWVDNKLFSEFLKEFSFYKPDSIEPRGKGEESEENNSLDEYRSIIAQMKANNQYQATKFASYLENYAKSFRFNYTEPGIFEFINNQIEKPDVFDSASSNKRGKVKLKKADEIIQKNKEQKYLKAEKSDRDILASVEEMKSIERNFQKLANFTLTSLNTCKTYEVKLEVFKIYLQLLLKQFGTLKTACEKRSLSLEYYKACESSLRGFQNITIRNDLLKQFENDFKGMLAQIEFETTGNHRVDFINFQMSCAQFYLYRENFSREDNRVDDFKPDPWQIQLMDAIDMRKTVIVSAPTSSGKTFASFYAIKASLLSSQEDVVIYVAPTKALVNQMLAGVYSRFKTFELARNKQLIGVFTRDHQENIFNSRVLLTVPECLEILYFSPDCQELVRKVKYVIFDEFQMINDEERGKVWERIVLMCESPFLAMSATIENPAMLRNWLAESRKQQQSKPNEAQLVFKNTFAYNHDVTSLFDEDNLRLDLNANITATVTSSFNHIESVLVNCSKRFSHVQKLRSLKDKLGEIRLVLVKIDDEREKIAIVNRINLEFNDVILIDVKLASTDFVYFTYMYNRSKSYEFDHSLANREKPFELLQLEGPVLSKFSPLNSLNEEGKNIETIMESMSLTPSDTHRLNEAMNKTFSDESACIDDVSHFKEKYFIKRNDVKQLEIDLKSKFIENYHHPTTENQKTEYKQLVEHFKRDSDFVQLPFNPNTDLPILIEYLADNKMLPCLVFSFNRTSCEHYAEILLDYYERKEAHLRKAKYAKKIEQLETKRARELSTNKKTRDNKEKDKDKKPMNKEELDNEEVTEDYSLLDEYLPECVLNEKRMYSQAEIDSQLNKAFDNNLEDWRCRAIRRGFAFHHAGINNKKRVCIESFFRNKFVQLVFCTTTLAQGIHVPCKSVIFIEDSIFLNPGLFKQCAGRAGRRGFDTSGSVILINIPEVKCKQLVSSKSAEIHPSYIISPTFILKLFNLIAKSRNEESSLKSALRVLQNGLMLHLNQFDFLEMINKYYFMFCTEFLIRNSLLSFDGQPIGLSKFVTFFGYHEPSNLVMAHIISNSNDFNLNRDDEQLEKDILVLLSHLFNRLDIYDPETVEKIRRENTWNSKVILDDLDETFKRHINKYNRNIQKVFNKNLNEQSRLFNHVLDYSLPLSRYNYSKESGIQEIDEFMKIESNEETRLISNFAALSGLKDDFKIEDKSVLAHMKPFYLDFKDLYPTIEFSKDFYGNQVYFNSYLPDFYNHECYKSILNENGLRDEMAYDFLYDFRKILQCLSELKAGSKRFRKAIKSINQKYIEKFENTDFDSTNRFHYKRIKKNK